MSRPFWLKLGLSAVSVGVTLCILEIGVRLLTTRDADGAPRFRLTRLKPYRLPVARVEREMAAYLSSDKTAILYDPELGWRPRPGMRDENADGFRTTSPAPNRSPTGGILRIALFGDSFTEGPDGGGWWRALEERLNVDGVKCEVLNFGVGGYGMDQAYLRWKKDGVLWKPDVVLFGFFVDDCRRNLNLLRLLRDPDSGIALMKPRFVLNGDGLSLINSPTPEPAKLPNLVRDFASWPLAGREHYFQVDDFRMTPWRWSRLGALIEAKGEILAQSAEAKEFFRIDGEAAQIAIRILRQMHQEVSATGASFYVANLPCAEDLTDLRKSGRVPQSDLLQQLCAEHEVIATEPALLAAGKGHGFGEFFVDGHYKAEFHLLVGAEIAGYLEKHPRGVTSH